MNGKCIAVEVTQVNAKLGSTSKLQVNAPVYLGTFLDLSTALAVLSPFWPSK